MNYRDVLTMIVGLVFASFAREGVVKPDCKRDVDLWACNPALSAARTPRAGDEGVFHGPLVRVIDGDSLEARIHGVVMEFRLAEIDAPEYDQPYGKEATALLQSLLRGAQLVIAPVDTDRYGRTVSHIWVGDLYVNRALVERGAAWFLSNYARDTQLFTVEEEARRAKRGLWALPAAQRIEPWTWRARKRERRAS